MFALHSTLPKMLIFCLLVIKGEHIILFECPHCMYKGHFVGWLFFGQLLYTSNQMFSSDLRGEREFQYPLISIVPKCTINVKTNTSKDLRCALCKLYNFKNTSSKILLCPAIFIRSDISVSITLLIGVCSMGARDGSIPTTWGRPEVPEVQTVGA